MDGSTAQDYLELHTKIISLGYEGFPGCGEVNELRFLAFICDPSLPPLEYEINESGLNTISIIPEGRHLEIPLCVGNSYTVSFPEENGWEILTSSSTNTSVSATLNSFSFTMPLNTDDPVFVELQLHYSNDPIACSLLVAKFIFLPLICEPGQTGGTNKSCEFNASPNPVDKIITIKDFTMNKNSSGFEKIKEINIYDSFYGKVQTEYSDDLQHSIMATSSMQHDKSYVIEVKNDKGESCRQLIIKK